MDGLPVSEFKKEFMSKTREADITGGYHGGADTSIAAHASTSADNRKAQRRQILEFIRGTQDYGAISEEVQNALDIPHQTCSARISEMCRDGDIRYNKARRNTSRGKAARVYFTGVPPTAPETSSARKEAPATPENVLSPIGLAKVREEAEKKNCSICNMILKSLGVGGQLRAYPLDSEDPTLPVAGQRKHVKRIP